MADTRYHKRLPGVQLVAEEIVRAVCNYALRRYAIAEPVRLDVAAFQEAHAAYWERVKAFKIQNGFPEGRVNGAKKAAIETFEVARRGNRIFVANDLDDQKRTWTNYCLVLYTLKIMMLYMEADTRTLPDLHRGDIAIALNKFPALKDSELDAALHVWCLYMDTYYTCSKSTADLERLGRLDD